MGRLLFILSSLFLFSFSAFGNEPPTYVEDPNPKDYSKGYVHPPLTAAEEKLQKEFDKASAEENWTFSHDVTQVGKFKTGLTKGPKLLGDYQQSFQLLGAPSTLPAISYRGVTGMPKVMDQGSCGSCVVFAFTGGFMYDMAIRGVAFPDPLSAQHLMNCGGAAGQCSGDWGERVGARLEKLACLVDNADYPYTARNASCSSTAGMACYGQAGKVVTIDGKFGSILFHLNEGKTIKVGIAADSRLMSYKSGIYNGFGSMGTNHYVTVVGAYCAKEAQNAAGECEVDADGDLVAGNQYGYLIIVNSWGPKWGDAGFIVMQFENAAGKRNNNVAGGSENAQVMESPIPIPPKGPVEFKMKNAVSVHEIRVEPGVLSAKELKASFLRAGYEEIP